MNADLIIRNGKVITVDKAFSIKEAIAVKGGKIIAVGTDDEIDKLKAPDAKIIDLNGQTILPGINESHMHTPFFGATRPPLALDLTPPNVLSIKNMADVLGNKVKEVKPGEWIRGFGWDQGAIEECKNDPTRLPRKWDIDSVSPDNPVVFTDFSAHNMLVNSKALEIARITKDTPDPESGEMERDPETGEPTGIFMELGAQSLVSVHVPLLSREEKKQTVLTALEHLNANGVTSFTDAAIGPGGEEYVYGVMSAEFIDIYQELLKEGNLTARANVLLLFGNYGGLTLDDLKNHMESFIAPQDTDDEWLKFKGVKIFADGIPPTKTSWVNEEYVTGGYGSLVIPGKSDEEKARGLIDMIKYVHSKGYQLGVHTTGDRAIDTAIDGFLEAIGETEIKDPRHYIIHGDSISREKAEVLARHNLGLSMQPFISVLISDFTPAVLGEERAAYEFPMKTALDAGVRLTSNSDAPVTYPNWRMGVQAAVLRENVNSGNVSGPEQCITVEDAIRTYTINGAWQDHMDHIKGSIEEGKLADFCVIDGDILGTDPHTIGEIPVVLTIVGGKVVFSAE
jgi:predicted amidohydrolase YtcJ